MEEDILIVSDDPQGRAALSVALSDQGFAARACHSPDDATSLIADVGVLLIDCASMPVDDGLRLAQSCRGKQPRLRCLVICDAGCSIHDEPATCSLHQVAADGGWLHIIQQPYSMMRFATKIKEIIAPP